MTARKTARRPASPERLAARFAGTMPPLPSMEDAINLDNTKDWDALTAAIQRRGWAGSLTPKQASELCYKVMEALPAEMQQALRDYSDAEGIQIAIEREAGFLVGLQVGLRLGGAR